MEHDLNALEQRIQTALAMMNRLQAENVKLKSDLALQQERMDQARNRLEHALDRLPSALES